MWNKHGHLTATGRHQCYRGTPKSSMLFFDFPWNKLNKPSILGSNIYGHPTPPYGDEKRTMSLFHQISSAADTMRLGKDTEVDPRCSDLLWVNVGYIYMYIYIHTCMHACIHTYIYT
jgi:hypothetical protein